MSRGRYRGPTVLEQSYSSIDRQKVCKSSKCCKCFTNREGRARGEPSFSSAFSSLTGLCGKRNRACTMTATTHSHYYYHTKSSMTSMITTRISSPPFWAVRLGFKPQVQTDDVKQADVSCLTCGGMAGMACDWLNRRNSPPNGPTVPARVPASECSGPVGVAIGILHCPSSTPASPQFHFCSFIFSQSTYYLFFSPESCC